MTITFKKTRDYIVIQMSGSLDTKLSREIEEDFEQILSNYPECNILLNMKDLKYLSSSGLKTIISLRSALNDANKQLKICQIGKAAREVFEMTKVLQFFKIYPDEESAILSINEIDPSDFD
jgi:anti-anti-sigma factor